MAALAQVLQSAGFVKTYGVVDRGWPDSIYDDYRAHKYHGPIKTQGTSPQSAAYNRANRLADGYDGWLIEVDGEWFQMEQVIPWRAKIVRRLMPELRADRRTYAYTVRAIPCPLPTEGPSND